MFTVSLFKPENDSGSGGELLNSVILYNNMAKSNSSQNYYTYFVEDRPLSKLDIINSPDIDAIREYNIKRASEKGYYASFLDSLDGFVKTSGSSPIETAKKLFIDEEDGYYYNLDTVFKYMDVDKASTYMKMWDKGQVELIVKPMITTANINKFSTTPTGGYNSFAFSGSTIWAYKTWLGDGDGSGTFCR